MSFFVTIITMCWDESYSECNVPVVFLQGPFDNKQQAKNYIQEQKRLESETEARIRQDLPYLADSQPERKYYNIHELPHRPLVTRQ